MSTGDQDVAGQTMRLEQAGAIKIFTDVRSGKSMDRPELTALLAYARPGYTLAVVRLDPEKASAALKLVEAGVSPTEAARQLGLGPAIVYREMALDGVRRTA